MADVYKFGGTSMGSPRGLEASEHLLFSGSSGPRVVVVSAPSGVTNLLLEGYNAQAAGNAFPEQTFRSLETRFRETYQQVHNAQHWIDDAFGEQGELQRRIQRGENQLAQSEKSYQYARLASFGEYFNQQLFTHFLSARGHNVRSAPMTLVRFTGNPTRAEYDRASDSSIKEYVHDGFNGTTVFAGYYGYENNSRVLVFDRGGSDYSQTLIARAIGATKAINCTDVDGIKAIDPRLIKNETRRNNVPTLHHVDYRIAQLLSHNGAKVLHARCLEPLIEASIPMEVRNTFNPDGKYTLINHHHDTDPQLLAVTGKKDSFRRLTLLTGTMDVPGYLQRVAQAFEGINIETITTSPIGIEVSTNDADANLEEVKQRLQDLGEVKYGNGSSMVALIGNQLGKIPGEIAKAFRILGERQIYIEQISKAGPQSVWFDVPHDRFEEAIIALYENLLERRD